MELILIFMLCGKPSFVVAIDGPNGFAEPYEVLMQNNEDIDFLGKLIQKHPNVKRLDAGRIFGTVCA